MKVTIEELNRIRTQTRAALALRSGGADKADTQKSEILVCAGTGCHSNRSDAFAEALEAELAENNLSDSVKVVRTGCFGLCSEGPICVVYPEQVYYSKVSAEDAPAIVHEHIIGGSPVSSLVFRAAERGDEQKKYTDTLFYTKQHRIALANCGHIDPENIDEYIARDGYFALAKALSEMSRQQVIDEVSASGLRGRGGAGFPTGRKWQLTANAEGIKKYVCANADEGDPGAFMDRSVLEGDPHCVLEAMAIAAYAIGADEGYIYVRAEYPIAVARLAVAIKQAADYGLLGENILGSGFNFKLSLRLGAGAFVCGEETALMRSVEGKRGEPRPRPPYPANSGVFGKPTLLNNVETYANIPYIIREGAKTFSAIGTEKSKGTKVFALGGKVNNTGLLEIPMGTSLREIIYDIGGGIPDGKAFKAAQTGGPSGGCITKENLDTPIDYDSLVAIGSMMGSGGLIVMDEDNCMVDVARFFMDFIVDESCGKCPTCRIGTKRMLEILTRICEGRGELSDIDRLYELAETLAAGSLCALGQTAANPVLSTLKHFRDEYIAHIVNKKCPAHVCRELLSYEVDPAACRACGKCAKICPAGAIAFEKKKPAVIDPEKCVKCGSCMESCRFDAIKRA